MSLQSRRESRQSTDGGVQRVPSEFTETLTEQTCRDSLPKYYPKDHEVTRWLINQMRCRNGLHHLVNLANLQPSLLSAYFELFDQPHLYIEARTGPGMPAYSIKTVLYLTPLAIAIYFRLRSVLRLLLDTSGTRIHARARQEIDVNAVCYVRRTKPRPGPYVMDEYSTTYPAIIAVRREFFAGLNMLMAANYHPQAPIAIVERMGTARETTYWFVDLLDFCVKLLNTRPGVDVIGLLQTISYRGLAEPTGSVSWYDPCVYDVRPFPHGDHETSHQGIWCSVFHRLARKGASRNYSNCGNRLIGLLEHVVAAGFFRQDYMPKGPVKYDTGLVTRRGSRVSSMRKMTPDMISKLTGPEKEAARMGIAADRDACLCLLTLWLERVRNRCLERQAQRLFRLLTTTLAETELLNDFVFPPNDIDLNTTLHPYWLATGLPKLLPKPSSSTLSTNPGDYLDDDANEVCELEPPQVNEIRQEIGVLGHSMGIVDYSDRLYSMGYPRMMDAMHYGGGIGDAVKYQQDSLVPAAGLKVNKLTPNERDSLNRCASEEYDCSVVDNRNALKHGDITTDTVQRKSALGANNRNYWTNMNRTLSTSPQRMSMKLGGPVRLQDFDENKNNVMGDCGMRSVTKEGPETQAFKNTPEKASNTVVADDGFQSRSVERVPQTKPVFKRPKAKRVKRPEKQKTK